MNKRIVFKDKLKEDFYQEFGYIVIPNFLNSEEISLLTELYQSKTTGKTVGFHRTLEVEDKEYKNTICTTIESIFSKNSKIFLNDYKFFLNSFMIKEPKTMEAFGLHQNWNFVEESKFSSLAIWVPLINTTKENGTMHVIERSQNLFNTFRGGPSIPSIFRDIESNIIQNYGKEMLLNAGDALFINDAILHYTTPNLTNIRRLAIAQVMIPKEAKPLYYYQDANNTNAPIKQYEIDDKFHLEFINRYKTIEPPEDCKLVKEFNVNLNAISFAQFEEKMNSLLNIA